jgi:hypothetical protein
MQNIEILRNELLGKRYGFGHPDIVQQGGAGSGGL